MVSVRTLTSVIIVKERKHVEQNLASFTLRLFVKIPILGWLVDWILTLQYICWQKYPDLTIRLSNFLIIGGVSTLIQAGLLFSLNYCGVETFEATTIAVTLAAFVNYVGNREFTWKDRFSTLTRTQQIIWYIPLYLLFMATTPTLYLKVVGIGTLHKFGIPILVCWIIFETIGSILNFVGAEKISFGCIIWAIRRISA